MCPGERQKVMATQKIVGSIRALFLMEGRSSGVAVHGDPKPPQAAAVKGRGGERCGKGPLLAGQVCDEKTKVCEPLLTRQKLNDVIETGRIAGPRTKERGCWCSLS